MTVDSISDTHKAHKSSEDEKTECSTPFCSPERESAAGKLKQEHEQDEHDNPQTPAKSPSTTTNEPSSPSVSSKVKSETTSSDEEYKDWPMVDIKEPSGNDVLYGRGGGTNHHEGNKRYRKMVELRKVDYVNSKRLDKPLVALDIIRQWRDQKPPGRFLKLDEASGLWSDVGDKKAREKTSQALREKAPLLRKQQEELMRENAPIPLSTSNDSSYSNETKTTRFNVPKKTVKASKNLNRGMLTRDHSLGRELVAPDEPISIKGFSWDAADNAADDSANDDPPPLPQASSWHSGYNHSRSNQPPQQQRPIQQYPFGSYHNRPTPQDSAGPPPPPAMNPHDRQHSLAVNPLHGASTEIHATNSFTEGYPHTPSHSGPSHHWSQHPGYPQPSPPRSDERLQAEWTKSSRFGDNDRDYRQTHSTENDYRSRPQPWHQSPSHGHERIHSDDYTNNRYNHSHPPPSSTDNGYMQRYDGGYNNNRYQQYPDNNSMQPPPGSYNHPGGMDWSSPTRSPDSMSYNNGQPQIPPSIPPQNPMQSTYNSSGISPGYSGGGYMDGGYRNPMMNSNSPSSVSHSRSLETSGSNVSSPSRSLPRPQNIKRDTSHQCENDETKSHVKRMNRQRSIGNTGSMSSLNEVSEMDMMNLRSHLRQSSIGQVDDMKVGSEEAIHPLKRPTSLKSNDRVPTIDCFQLGLDGASSPLDETGVNAKLERPQPLGGDHRGSSVASIQIEDIAGIINKPSSLNNNDRGGTFGSIDQDLLNHVAI